MVKQKALNTVELLCSSCIVENAGWFAGWFSPKLATEQVYLYESPLYKELQNNINSTMKEKFKTLNVEPNSILNNQLSINEYLAELEKIPKQIIQEFILSSDKYKNLTAADILEPVIKKHSLKDNTDYLLQPLNGISLSSDPAIDKFVFQNHMPIEEFINNHFKSLCDSPRTGYIENPNNFRDKAPFNPIVMYQNILNNAQCIVNHTLSKNPSSLNEFEEREAHRIKIAYKVMEKISSINKFDTTQRSIFLNIVEDLRGPYYQVFFINKKEISDDDIENTELITKLYIDNVKSEKNENQEYEAVIPEISDSCKTS